MDNNKLNFDYMFNRILYDDIIINKFNEFLEKYEDKSDKYIYQEIERVQKEVPDAVKRRHIKNLEAISKFEGFVTEDIKREIEKLKRLINVESSENKKISDRELENQFFSPTSLLLWFLLLVMIYRRRRYRKPYHRRPYRH
ncbi:hypothetical protein TR13x_01170 [Caloranaerobacter sp. TR13]|uniref:hypothetical protein n=1 Tax=Caloranaerobacter sp. TR13 TaxID=1302151 RepID=UPI0006D454F6|nr:hypothetical protein [Caloranaerobacter sp. TR13]KPU27987.1 hypothetical protein TR13x_01170 [Caloranaerobacter sp. TR13]